MAENEEELKSLLMNMKESLKTGFKLNIQETKILASGNIQGWFPLGWTGLILQSKGLSRVFSNTTVQKHQFFSAQPSFWSNSHIHTWLLEKS